MTTSLDMKVDQYAQAKVLSRKAAYAELVEAGLRSAGVISWQVSNGVTTTINTTRAELVKLLKVLGYFEVSANFSGKATTPQVHVFKHVVNGDTIKAQPTSKIREGMPDDT